MNRVMRSRISPGFGRVFSLLLVLITLLAMTDTSHAQNPIALRFQGDGNYATVADGVGMDGTTTGTITLNVPGTPIAAYLYWSGFFDRTVSGGDNQVSFTVDGALIATDIYDYVANTLGDDTAAFGPNLWYGTLDRSVYMAEVTQFVQTGTHNYTISDFQMLGAGATQDGAGLVVVYQNAAEPYSRVIIQDGLSIFFPVSNPPQTFRHSDTACLDFPSDTAARNLNYSLFVGGLVEEVPPNTPRTNALWAYTGAGTSLHNEIPPRNIIDVVDPLNAALGSTAPIAGAVPVSGVNYPPNQNDPDLVNPTFGASNVLPDLHDGDQWDTYINTLNVPAGNTFACFQIQTFDLYSGQNGSSGNWMALIGRIPLPVVTPPATNTPVPANTPVPGGSPAPTAISPAPGPGTHDPIVSKVPNPQNVVPGESVTWTVTITNPDSVAMSSLLVTDPLDARFFSQVVSATASSGAVSATISGLNVTYDVPVIQPGETLTLTLVVRTRADLAPGTVGTNFVIVERPGRPRYQSPVVSLSMIRRLPETGYPPR